MKKLLLLLFISIPFFMYSQLNTTVISQVDYVAEGKGTGNDIWGYVAPNGDEYAIVGTTTGTLIYDLTDPANPKEITFITGSNSTWRDMKQWGEFVYVTTDSGNDGLLIIDMSSVMDSVPYKFIKPQVTTNGDDTISLNTCHNIYIDENGIIYLAGCQGRGVEFFDAKTDPWDPEYLGSIISPYSHDAYAKGDTLYASQLSADFYMYDVSDKSNPISLGGINTTSDFTHNAWADPTNTYAFTTDETAFGNLDAYDVSDPGNMKLLDTYKPKDPDNAGIIPHNTHYFNGYLVTSWYTSGLIVVDGSRPHNLIKVAEYDTYEGPDGGFNGMWGTTPYLPSGIVLCNDRQTGMYVFDVDYKKACYLEGQITDASNSNPINNVTIGFDDIEMQGTSSDFGGMYANGRVQEGPLKVTYSHPEYFSETVDYTLETGIVTDGNVELEPKPKYQIEFTVLDSETNEPLQDVSIELDGDELDYAGFTNSAGTYTFEAVEQNYAYYAGVWGHQEILGAISEVDFPDNLNITILLDKGYADAFVHDLGWKAITDATTGEWTRGFPNGTFGPDGPGAPGSDSDFDIGGECFVTGNADTNQIGSDDVDNGVTILQSAKMDFTDMGAANISYERWFYNSLGEGNPNDYLTISLTNSTETIVLDSLIGINNFWNDFEVTVTFDQIEFTDQMRIEVKTLDQDPGHIVEAGFDNFRVDLLVNDDEIPFTQSIDFYPNPTDGTLYFDHHVLSNIRLLDMTGRLMYQNDNLNTSSIDISSFQTGMYFIQYKTNEGIVGTKKIILQ